MNTIQKTAAKNAVLTALYIGLVAGFMSWGESIKIGRANKFLAPVAFLSLFVLSAAVTSFLMFGKPAQLYIDGKKKEALSLITYTLIFFASITVAFLVLLVFWTR